MNWKESPEADLLPLEPVAPQAKTAVSPFVMPPMLLPIPPAETPEAPVRHAADSAHSEGLLRSLC